MTVSACLIFNPVAGQGDPDQDLGQIRYLLEPHLDLEIQLTTAEMDAGALAKAAVKQGFDLMIASGGDGTLSAVAEATINTGIPLGIIARGTANAFATALGIPTLIDAACETILTGYPRTIDAAWCNHQPMTLLAGIGFEAETVARADRELKNRFGRLAYIFAGFQELNNLSVFDATVEVADRVIKLQAAAITIANIAPPTSVLAQGPGELIPDDGLLDVTFVAPANSLGAIAAVYNLLQCGIRGEATDRPDTGYLRTAAIKVETDPPQRVVVDGELVGETPIEVECIPGGLTILVPSTAIPEPLLPAKLEGLPNLQVTLKKPENLGSTEFHP